MAARAAKRLHKELTDLQRGPPAHISKVEVDEKEALKRWVIVLKGSDGTLYEGEEFRLQFTFPPEYPLEAPEVIFLRPQPIHPHIYSNGHICLDLLYTAWTPALTVQAVCLSLLSMLSSSPEKKPPSDDSSYVRRAKNRSPKKTRWDFHDDAV